MRDTIDRFKTLDDEVKGGALNELNRGVLKTVEPAQRGETSKKAAEGLVPSGDDAKVKLWLTLLIGLFALGVVAVVAGIVLATLHYDTAAAWAIATAVVSGTVGLFAKSPTQT